MSVIYSGSSILFHETLDLQFFFFVVVHFIPVFTCSTVQESSVLIQLFSVQAVRRLFTPSRIYI